MGSKRWAYRVLRCARRWDGKAVDGPTLATFERRDTALCHAERFAAEQAAKGACDLYVEVRKRGGGTRFHMRHTIAILLVDRGHVFVSIAKEEP